MGVIQFFRSRRNFEEEKISRLEDAEHELEDLQRRADKAIFALNKRRQENHWRESVERMIHGCD